MRLFYFLAVWAILLGGGCGPRAPVPVPVAGQVELDGKPLSGGRIRFSEEGKPPLDMDVRDGKFAGKLTPGSYRVEIGIFQKAVQPPGLGLEGLDPGMKNILPERYHLGSTMTALVPEGGVGSLQYKVESR